MTRPYTRACRQTNFSEGGFVNYVPFLLFFFYFVFFFLPSFFSCSNVYPFVLFSSRSMAIWVLGGVGEVHLITQGRWVVNVRLIICQNDSIVLNKISTIAVKLIF